MTQRPFLEELGEVWAEVWHGVPPEVDDEGREIFHPPGLAVTLAESRAELRASWREFWSRAR